MSDKAAKNELVLIREAAPAVDTNAYAAGDLMGAAEIELKLPTGSESGQGGVIQSVGIIDLAAQAQNIDVMFFDTEPSGTTFTDNAAFDPADADLAHCVGVASITDWKSFADNAYGQVLNVAIPFVATGSLYAVLVSRGTGTYGASDITLRVGILAATLVAKAS